MPESTTSEQFHFETLFNSIVSDPWEQEGKTIARPWNATPALRKEWLARLTDKSRDHTERLVCSIGLSRCAGLNADESNEVDLFLRFPFPPKLIQDFLAILLLTGGTPPSALHFIYFAPMLESFPSEAVLWWSLAIYFRHPANMELAQTILGRPTGPDYYRQYLRFHAGLNPLVTARNKSPNPWLQATNLFHPRQSILDQELSHPLNKVAALLRWFRPSGFPDNLGRVWQGAPINEDFHLPAEEYLNPTHETIEKISKDPRSLMWQFYNPLWVYPWKNWPIPTPNNYPEPDSALAALTLCGYPRISMYGHYEGKEYPWQDYPFKALST